MPGPLDDFLEQAPTRPASAELRDALLHRTSALVRLRRRIRMLAVAAALAAAVMIAAAIVWLRPPGAATAPDEQPVAQKQSPPAPPPAPSPAPSPRAPPPEQQTRPTAVALEWQAFDAPREQKAALYRQAGDRYVEDADDVPSAVRCYGQAVRNASNQELAFNRDDNWLVMALKFDEIERRKEK
jgi:hypothetical protein